MASLNNFNAEIVKLYYSTGSSTTVIREIAKHHEKKMLSKIKIQILVDRFEKTGSGTDGHHSNPGRPKSVRSADNITSIQDVISETPQRSVRKIFGDVTNTVSRSSVHRILHYVLNLKPYTLSIMQHLNENDIESRQHFAHWVKTNPAIVDLL